MRAFLPLALAVLTLALAAGATRAFGEDEENCPLDKLPAKVTAAVTAQWPKGTIVSATKETEKGVTTYEVKVKDGDRVVEATVSEEGKILETEAAIAAKDLPKAVTDALAAKYPKSEIRHATEITAAEVKSYEVVLVTAEKKTMEVTLDAKGAILEEEEAGKGEGGDKEAGGEGMGR
jgi:uncharacterized membrane protein YkoI